jgi:hypothetical protein
VPGLGGVAELAEAPDLPGFALDPTEGRLFGQGRNTGEQNLVAGQPEESWLGKFGRVDRWSFCLRAARMAREQERR